MLECEDGYGMKIIDLSCSKDFSTSSILNTTDNTITNSSTALNEVECSQEFDDSSYMFDHVIRMCLDDGSWSGKDVECLSMCNPLVPPKHGKVQLLIQIIKYTSYYYVTPNILLFIKNIFSVSKVFKTRCLCVGVNQY